jgi:hypothetical protein
VNLILNKFSAAHCIQNRNTSERLRPQDLTLIFGAHDLDDLFQSGTFFASASEIIVHPDWNPSEDKRDADIAVLLTEIAVPFTDFIKPVCLSESQDGATSIYVTGWSENAASTIGYEPIPKQLKVQLKSHENCMLESPMFAETSSKRTFCGGSRNVSSLNFGKH